MRALPCAAFSLILLALCACGLSKEDRKQFEDFAAAFEAASKAKTTEPMLKLYHLEGADETTINILRIALQNELGLPIRSIEFEPLTGGPEETIEYEFEGKRFGPTLEPLMRMRVRYDTDDELTSLFSIGQIPEGSWRIVTAQPID